MVARFQQGKVTAPERQDWAGELPLAARHRATGGTLSWGIFPDRGAVIRLSARSWASSTTSGRTTATS